MCHITWLRVYSSTMLREGIRKKNTGLFGNFSQHRGGGLLNPKTFVILTIALKTPLKHLKITQKFPTLPKKIGKKWSKFPKGGGGGGGPTFGKNSQKIPYFFPEAFPNFQLFKLISTYNYHCQDHHLSFSSSASSSPQPHILSFSFFRLA